MLLNAVFSFHIHVWLINTWITNFYYSKPASVDYYLDRADRPTSLMIPEIETSCYSVFCIFDVKLVHLVNSWYVFRKIATD